MILSATTSLVAAGVVGYTYIAQNKVPVARSDAKKIQRICANRGLVVKEGKATRTMQQLTRRDIEGGKEYVFRVPLGLSYNDFEKQLPALQDGLNNRRTRQQVTLNDITSIRSIKDVLELWRREPQRVNKEVELSYDGVLKVRCMINRCPTCSFTTKKHCLNAKGGKCQLVLIAQVLKNTTSKRRLTFLLRVVLTKGSRFS